MRSSRLAPILATVAAVAAVLALGSWPSLASRLRPDGYVEQVRASCDAAYDELRESRGTYFDSVVLISEIKHARLSEIGPPAERRALHTRLMAGESRLLADARTGQARLRAGDRSSSAADLARMRAMQRALALEYQRLGVSGCSQ